MRIHCQIWRPHLPRYIKRCRVFKSHYQGPDNPTRLKNWNVLALKLKDLQINVDDDTKTLIVAGGGRTEAFSLTRTDIHLCLQLMQQIYSYLTLRDKERVPSPPPKNDEQLCIELIEQECTNSLKVRIDQAKALLSTEVRFLWEALINGIEV